MIPYNEFKLYCIREDGSWVYGFLFFVVLVSDEPYYPKAERDNGVPINSPVENLRVAQRCLQLLELRELVSMDILVELWLARSF